MKIDVGSRMEVILNYVNRQEITKCQVLNLEIAGLPAETRLR